MARAKTVTKLPIDEWARIVGLNPLHLNGAFVRTPNVCQEPWMQYAHQSNDRIGREEIAEAIAQAESDIEGHLGFRLLPDWEVDEWRPTNRPWNPELSNLSHTDIRGFSPTVQAKWGYLVSGGIRSKEMVSSAAAVSFADEDGDGYKETAKITATVSFENPCEVRLFIPVDGDMIPEAGMDEWEIRPVRVTITAGVATIVCRRELLVKPELQERLVPPTDDSHLRGVDASNDSNFLATIDVFRVYNDPQLQVQFLWEPRGCGSCSGGGCSNCSYAAQYGCLTAREDPRNSIAVFQPATWNTSTLTFDAASWLEGREPDLVRLWYYAGWRNKRSSCPTTAMDPNLARSVAYYAAALLDRPVCGCNNLTAFIEQLRADWAQMEGRESRRLRELALDNPFGTKYGAIFAWKRVKDLALGRGTSL